MGRRRLVAALIAGLPACAGAAPVDLDLPHNARQTGEVALDETVYALPTGPFADGRIPVTEVRGGYLQRAWIVAGTGLTTVQLLDPMRAALQRAGFDIRLECAAAACGGFDFRFGTEILPAPEMFVDMFQYRFLSALHADGSAVSVLATRVGSDAFLQIIQVTAGAADGVRVVAPQNPGAPAMAGTAPPGRMAERLLEAGHVVLEDLEFATGSDQLADQPYASLETLAGFLRADPARRVALVGHTDAVGALDGNVALSRRRAASVMNRLSGAHAVPAAQMSAGGMGYLAPRASNLTPEGRARNRRVEAVLLNTE